jgi:hypothetical protein
MMSKLSARIRLLRLLKIKSMLIELYNEDDYRYDICSDDTGMIVDDISLDEIGVEDVLERIKVMVSIVKLGLEAKDLT